jgi:hypothetical protein
MSVGGSQSRCFMQVRGGIRTVYKTLVHLKDCNSDLLLCEEITNPDRQNRAAGQAPPTSPARGGGR